MEWRTLEDRSEGAAVTYLGCHFKSPATYTDVFNYSEIIVDLFKNIIKISLYIKNT